jgi:hypothetical protein
MCSDFQGLCMVGLGRLCILARGRICSEPCIVSPLLDARGAKPHRRNVQRRSINGSNAGFFAVCVGVGLGAGAAVVVAGRGRFGVGPATGFLLDATVALGEALALGAGVAISEATVTLGAAGGAGASLGGGAGGAVVVDATSEATEPGAAPLPPSSRNAGMPTAAAAASPIPSQSAGRERRVCVCPQAALVDASTGAVAGDSESSREEMPAALNTLDTLSALRAANCDP